MPPSTGILPCRGGNVTAISAIIPTTGLTTSSRRKPLLNNLRTLSITGRRNETAFALSSAIYARTSLTSSTTADATGPSWLRDTCQRNESLAPSDSCNVASHAGAKTTCGRERESSRISSKPHGKSSSVYGFGRSPSASHHALSTASLPAHLAARCVASSSCLALARAAACRSSRAENNSLPREPGSPNCSANAATSTTSCPNPSTAEPYGFAPSSVFFTSITLLCYPPDMRLAGARLTLLKTNGKERQTISSIPSAALQSTLESVPGSGRQTVLHLFTNQSSIPSPVAPLKC